MENDCSNSSNTDGNTISSVKQIAPAKHWCFTLNNYTKQDIEDIKNIDCSKVPIIVFQEEEESTPHLQGYLMFNTKGRAFSLGLSKRIHWEKKSRYSSLQQARFYCCDPDKRKENGLVYLRGWKPPQKIKILEDAQLKSWQKKIVNIIEQPPCDRKIHWFWEPEGGIGKSVFCKYLCVKHKAIILSGSAKDMKCGIMLLHEKTNEWPEIILIDIPRTQDMEYISYQGLEEIKNGCFYSPKYEGGMAIFNCPHMIIFSNDTPVRNNLSKDRWIIERL